MPHQNINEAKIPEMLTKRVSLTGLSASEAKQRLSQFGANEIIRKAGPSAWKIFISQFSSPLIWILFLACVISAALGEVADSIAICAIVILNAGVGFMQEFKAERATAALISMTAPQAKVLRQSKIIVIAAREVVPGDFLVLDAGDIVAADAKLIEANSLTTNEATLTGESQPVEKLNIATPPTTSLADKKDYVFLGTHVASGSGIAEVLATGMSTELGKIANLLDQTHESKTPLQVRIEHLSRLLMYACLALVTTLAAIGFLRGQSWLEVFISSVSLAVAAVPEGLPAIVTVALALGVQRMSNRHVLVRKLPAIETLGSTTVICTDKTGTLTTGIMQVRELRGLDHQHILFAAAACCDAELHDPNLESDVGDPTEIAILRSASERGILRNAIEFQHPRRKTYPFDSIRKRMSVYRDDGILYVKGAVESILPLCNENADVALQDNKEMAEKGLRVLAVAVGNSAQESNLKFLGLIGLADPPRKEAIEAIATAQAAGIRTIMITGDHPVTAKAIAKELGILTDQDDPQGSVHARVTPEDKIQIVKNWKDQGEIVAMTGDGVNDAPALREAHVGIAMGKTGTDVSKEASDMILTDDNFASIVAAIHEGRGIFENIRKAVVYLLAGNTSELLVMLGAAVIGFPVPFLPIHLLWINLVTDGLPALALVLDPASTELMNKPPKQPKESLLGASEWKTIFVTALIEGVLILLVFSWFYRNQDLHTARNLAFSSLVFSQMFRAFAARSPILIFWKTEIFGNLWLLGVVILTLFLQIGIYYVPQTQRFFQLQTLSHMQWAVALLLGLIPVSIIEIRKLIASIL